MAREGSTALERLTSGETTDTSVDLTWRDRAVAAGRQQLRQWKSWAAAVALAAVAVVLHDIGGVTIDTVTFALAAALVVAYRIATLRYDIE